MNNLIIIIATFLSFEALADQITHAITDRHNANKNSDPKSASYKNKASINPQLIYKDKCKDFSRVGHEDGLVKCDMEFYASTKPEYLKSCRAINRENQDRTDLCLKNIMSNNENIKKHVENCMKLEGEKSKGSCISIVANDEILRSRLPEDQNESVPRFLDMQFSDGFNTPLLSADEPDKDLLRKCIDTFSSNSRISLVNSNSIAFRTTVNPQQPTKRMQGSYLKKGLDVYYFSDKSLEDYFDKNCKNAGTCTLVANVGNESIQVTMTKNVDEKGELTNLPMNVAFGNSLPIYSVGANSIVESRSIFTPEKIDPIENKFINAQIARAVASSLSLESVNYQHLEKIGVKVSDEAYAQIKKGVDSCTNLLDLMITENRKNIYLEVDLLLKQLANIYQSQRSVASDKEVQQSTTSAQSK